MKRVKDFEGRDGFQSLIGLILTGSNPAIPIIFLWFQSLIGLILTILRRKWRPLYHPISIPYRSYSNPAAWLKAPEDSEISIPYRSYSNSSPCAYIRIYGNFLFQSLIGLILTPSGLMQVGHSQKISIPYRSYSNEGSEPLLWYEPRISIPYRSYSNYLAFPSVYVPTLFQSLIGLILTKYHQLLAHD